MQAPSTLKRTQALTVHLDYFAGGLTPQDKRTDAIARMVFVDGRCDAVAVRAPRISTWGAWDVVTHNVDLRLQDGVISGQWKNTLRVPSSPSRGESVSDADAELLTSHSFTTHIQAQVINRTVRGTWHASFDDQVQPSTGTTPNVWLVTGVSHGHDVAVLMRDGAGAVLDAGPGAVSSPAPGDADIEANFVFNDSAGTLWLALRDGRVAAAYAITPTRSRFSHAVDATALAVTESGLAGVLVLHQGGPHGHDRVRSVPMRLAATWTQSGIAGTLAPLQTQRDESGGVLAAGVLSGTFCLPPSSQRALVYIQQEDALGAPSYWKSRCFVGVSARSEDQFIRSDHPKQAQWTGRVESLLVAPKSSQRGGTGSDVALASRRGARLSFGRGAFEAQVLVSIDSKGENPSGAYEFAYDGWRIGDTVGGTLVTTLNQKPCKETRFWGVMYQPNVRHGYRLLPFVEPLPPADVPK